MKCCDTDGSSVCEDDAACEASRICAIAPWELTAAVEPYLEDHEAGGRSPCRWSGCCGCIAVGNLSTRRWRKRCMSGLERNSPATSGARRRRRDDGGSAISGEEQTGKKCRAPNEHLAQSGIKITTGRSRATISGAERRRIKRAARPPRCTRTGRKQMDREKAHIGAEADGRAHGPRRRMADARAATKRTAKRGASVIKRHWTEGRDPRGAPQRRTSLQRTAGANAWMSGKATNRRKPAARQGRARLWG